MISEIVADNSGTTLSDQDGFPADWIEIQNPGAAASINGYYLTDDPLNLTKWRLPDVTIGANGFLVVFATGKNRAVAGSELHANFALGASGEYLALVHPDGQTVVSSFDPEFPEQLRDISYGLGSGGPVAAADFVLLGAEVTYLVPTADIGSTWQEPTFDDAGWTAAHTALGWGYSTSVGDDIAADGDLRTPMRSVNASVYIRIPFQVEDPTEVVSLTLKVKVDDGFVAYINGTKVAEKNAPASLLYNSAATKSEEVDVGEAFEFFPLSFAGSLVAGENILALQGLNDSAGSSDFIIIPEMVGEVQDLSAPPQLGYFETPTPGSPNGTLSAAPPNLVEFSVPSQAFTDSFQLSLSVSNPGAIIRYTEDGTKPSNDPAGPSPAYTGPITVNSSKMIRAQAFITGAIDGPGRTEGYMKLAPSEANFSSDLPVVMLSKFSAGDPPGANASTRVAGFMLIYEPDELTGRTTLSGVPALATRGGYRKRGSSSGGFAKYAMSFESWDEFDEDKDIKPLGFSKEADWILNSRYTFDMALIRNPFLYRLSNQIGRWAVKTQMIEIYHDATGGDVTSNDYFGVYCFMEKIEPDGGRLDIPDLDPWDIREPEVTGGYVFKRDRQGVGELSITAQGMGTLPLTDPGVLPTEQRTYIQGYLAEMDTSLNAANGINASTGKHFSEYLDVSSFIDNFWLNILSMDPDWGRLSQYFYKDRNGLVHGGPIWDYDRTMGSRDGRDDNPRVWDINDSSTWYDSEYPWFGKLFGFTNNNQPTPGASSTRPDVMQQIIDRWYQLRSNEFSQPNMEAIIDSLADEIRESQARSFARWTGRNPGSIQGQSFADPSTTGWEREISHLKGWLKARSEWIDDQFFIPPTLNQYGGVVPQGFQLTMNSNQGTVYYTLDGSDPRAPGGSIAQGAIPFDGGPVDDVLMSEDASCKYFVPVDATLEASWFMPAFDDATWLDGMSGLGFESANGALNSEIVTDIKAQMQPADAANNGSCYFRYEFDFDNAASINELLLEIKYDDAFIAYINGVEVARSARAPATVAWNSTATAGGPGDTSITAYVFNGIADSATFDFNISAFKSSVINGTNVLAIQGMNSSSGGSDFLIKPRLSVNHTVVSTPIALSQSSTVVARAYDGQQWGAPTSANFVVGAELADATNLVVSELMYNPETPNAGELEAGFFDGDQFEFLELLNISASRINLSDISFTNGIDFDFVGTAVTELAPGERVLVVREQAAFVERYGAGFNAQIAGEFANDTNLADGGERLAFSGAGGVIRDFTYDDKLPWPEAPDGDGPSLVLVNPTSNPDHALAASWATSPGAMGSPGEGDGTTFSGDPDADDDHDRLNAFAEYAFGTSDSDPTAGSSVLRASIVPGGILSVSFPKNLAAGDALISIELSADLTAWIPAGEMLTLVQEVQNGDGTATLTYQTTEPIVPGDDLFVRLKVTSR